MRPFNVIRINHLECPFCGSSNDWEIRFMYGDCREFYYDKGDTIVWGGNDIGRNVGGMVRTSGKSQTRCLICNYRPEAEIIFFDNRVTAVSLSQEPILIKGQYEIINTELR